jgi:hypothetical protein
MRSSFQYTPENREYLAKQGHISAENIDASLAKGDIDETEATRLKELLPTPTY